LGLSKKTFLVLTILSMLDVTSAGELEIMKTLDGIGYREQEL